MSDWTWYYTAASKPKKKFTVGNSVEDADGRVGKVRAVINECGKVRYQVEWESGKWSFVDEEDLEASHS